MKYEYVKNQTLKSTKQQQKQEILKNTNSNIDISVKKSNETNFCNRNN